MSDEKDKESIPGTVVTALASGSFSVATFTLTVEGWKAVAYAAEVYLRGRGEWEPKPKDTPPP